MRALRIALVTVLATLAGLLHAQQVPPPFEALYSVQRGLFSVAETRVVFSRPADGRYVYRSRTRATGLAGLFRDTQVRERSEGWIVEGGFRPARYRYRRTGDAPREGELRFYWDDGQVVNDVGGHPWRLDIPPTTRDRVVGSLQLMHDLAAGKRELVYPVADGGRLRNFRFRVTGRERIETAVGELETLRVVRTGGEAGERTVLWCAESLHFLPVRIEHRDDQEGAYAMRLERVNGLAPSAGDTTDHP